MILLLNFLPYIHSCFVVMKFVICVSVTDHRSMNNMDILCSNVNMERMMLLIGSPVVSFV